MMNISFKKNNKKPYSWNMVLLTMEWILFHIIIYPNKKIDEPFDGIVYSVFVGMGFATPENLIFVM